MANRRATLAMAWLLLSVASGHAWSWSARGHSQIAVYAFSGLTPGQQQALAPLVALGPWADDPSTSAPAHLAQAAVWPDRVRDLTLQQLFERYGSGSVPAPLRGYRRKNTSDWHYVNGHFLTASGDIVSSGNNRWSCPPKGSGKLYRIWAPLLKAFAAAEDPRDKAILLAFIVHLGADAYQPLHVFAALDQHCKHDSGGNGFCVEAESGACHTNLHQLWDRGFEVFESDWQAEVPFIGDIANLQRQELSDFAAQVYPVNAGEVKTPAYQRQAAARVRTQARAASAHLRQVLSHLLGGGEERANRFEVGGSDAR